MYGFVIGKEAAMDLEVQGPNGVIVIQSMGLIDDFDVEAETSVITVAPVNQGGVPVKRRVHKGWKGTFNVTRQGGIMDTLEQLFQDNFFDGKTEIYATFTQTINNPDGTKNVFKYPNSIVMVPKMGSFAQDKEVKFSVQFECPRRQQLL